MYNVADVCGTNNNQGWLHDGLERPENAGADTWQDNRTPDAQHLHTRLLQRFDAHRAFGTTQAGVIVSHRTADRDVVSSQASKDQSEIMRRV